MQVRCDWLHTSLQVPLYPYFLGRGLSARNNAHSPPSLYENAMTRYQNDWSWKPKDKDKPRYVSKKKLKGNSRKSKKRKVSRKESVEFYKSNEWQELRVRVLHKYDGMCMLCGRSPRIHGVVLNVDHIKPRAKFPELSLDIENLQILCGACNKGKGNKYAKDFRPDDSEVGDELDRMTLSHLKGFLD